VTNLLPRVGEDLDPISRTWLRGLIMTSLEQRITALCWHIEHCDGYCLATGYVTMTKLYEGDRIRRAWVKELGLREMVDEPGAYTGHIGTLTVYLPNKQDPDEHCRICGEPFDPRDMRSGGPGTSDGVLCRSCTSTPK
jgi:hypothetical protein